MDKIYKIGYTQGVFDMFHIGHLNILNNAKKHCDYLIVGVNSDSLVETYKGKKTVVNEVERCEIVKNIKAVDECHIVSTLDKISLHEKWGFNAVFIGDDWKGSDRWNETQKELAKYKVEVVYLPYTKDVNSTGRRKYYNDKVDEGR